MMIRLVVFDAVGTVIHPAEPIQATYARLFNQQGINVQGDEIKVVFKAAFQHAFKHHRSASSSLGRYRNSAFVASLPENDRRTLEYDYSTSEKDQYQKWQQVVDYCVRHFTPDVDENVVDEIFRQLWNHFAEPEAWIVDSGLQAIVNHLHKRAIPWVLGSNFDRRLKQVAIGHRTLAACDFVFDSASVGYEKPDARFYQHIEKTMHVHSADIVFIGDDYLNDVIAPLACDWQAILLGDDKRAKLHVPRMQDLLKILGG